MSQIFDALHQSQREHAGGDSREFSAARELLEVVERNAAGSAILQQPRQDLDREQFGKFPPAKVILPPESKFVCFTQTESLAAEKFRFLAIRLRHLQQKRMVKRIVVTSAVTGEGKSMVAANLACALAGGKQQQVLLVEGDFRRPSLAQQLGLSELPGLSQLLESGSESPNNIFTLESSGFCILPAGSIHTNPLELLQPAKLSVLMDRLSVSFDWVVIDSPPVLPLADTSIWMRLADAIILVTRPGITAKRQLQRTLEAIEQAKLLGAVLNASSEATTSNYYYHYTACSDSPQSSPAK